MILDYRKEADILRGDAHHEKLKKRGAKVDYKGLGNERSLKQNSALHLYFTMIANALNDLGTEFCYTGVKGVDISVRYTAHIVKEFFWKPIQLALFEIESTTKINTEQINDIREYVDKFFAEKGVVITFPSIEDLIKK